MDLPPAIHASTTPILPANGITTLIAQCYRVVTFRELSEIRALYRDEKILEQKVKSLLQKGGVADQSPLHFFMAALRQE